MLKIGCHLSIGEGYYSMGERIIKLGGNTFQYFTKNPKGRAQTKAPAPEDVAALRDLVMRRKMTMPLAHAPYTYNPCSKDEEVRRYSGESMHGELLFLENLPGSM